MTKRQFKKFFSEFKYLDHEFSITFNEIVDKATITKYASLTDVNTGKQKMFSDSRAISYRTFNEFELLNYLRNWFINLAIHENDESMSYKGKKIFNPHKVWSHITER